MRQLIETNEPAPMQTYLPTISGNREITTQLSKGTRLEEFLST